MPKKILLAEDSLTIQKVFELTFAQGDFSLTTVDNGTDAVRLASEIAPDLVVADVTLPGRSGFEVAAELAASPATRGCPVLILSGTLGPFDEEKFKASGAKAVLFKPFESQELIDKVNELTSAAEAGATPARGTEEWDFSDVLEEVEGGGSRIPGVARVEGFPSVPGAAASGSPEIPALGEFDVSLEEVEGAESAAPAAAPAAEPDPVPSAAAPEPPFEPGFPCEEDPAGVTDLSPALSEVEDLEEIEDLEEMELLHKESGGPLAVGPPPAPEPVDEERVEAALGTIAPAFDECALAADLPDLEPAYAPRPEAGDEVDLEAIVEDLPGAPAPAAAVVEPAPAAPAFEALAAEALREQFAGRVRTIVEQVATEAVEKIMWEWMDRLSAEFSERIRESVESVAWDVIPKTAEALIREEIERIRDKEGRQEESR